MNSLLFKKISGYVILFAAFTILFCLQPTSSASAASGPMVPTITGVKGDYANLILESTPRSDGKIHINTPATIARLQELNVTTYAFLIWTQGHYWDDLRLEFMPAAQTAGIKIWVYLTPPSEGESQPFGGNYTLWAQQIATLANSYPNLEAWVIDDFTANLDVFTPASLEVLQAAAHAIRPQLALFVIAYYEQATSSFAAAYKDSIDGIIFPHGERTPQNLSSYIDTLYNNFSPYGIPIYFMPYATFSNFTTFKSAEYIKQEIEIAQAKEAEGKLNGILIYCTPKATTDETWLLPNDPYKYATHQDWYYELTNDALGIPWAVHNTAAGANVKTSQTATVTQPNNTSISFDAYSYAPSGYAFGSDGNVARISYPAATPGAAGIYAELSQMVAVTAGSSSSVSFKIKDDYTAGVSGYMYKQLLIDDVVVWQQDVAGQTTNWQTVNVNLSPYLTGKTTAKLSLRLKIANAVTYFPVTTTWDDIVPTGFKVTNPYFDGDTGWTKFQNASTTADAFRISWPSGKPSVNGATGYKIKTASVQPAGPYTLNMKIKDDFVFNTTGYHFMQLVIDNTVVWEQDVANGSADWSNINLNLASHLTGKTSATFVFRVFDKVGVNNFPINADWAIISTQGFTLSDSTFTGVSSMADLWNIKKGSTLEIAFPPAVASTAGSYGSFYYGMAVTPGQGNKTLAFKIKDDFTGATSGHHFAQVVVNGSVVWERDVAGGTTAYQSVSVDLTSALADKLNGEVEFRVYDKAAVGNFPVKVEYTDVVATGFTLNNETIRTSSGWSYKEMPATKLGPFTTEIVSQGPGMALLQMMIDGKVVWSQDASRLSASPWSKYTVDTSAYTAGKSTAQVSFRLYFTQAVSGLGLTVRLDNLQVQGLGMQNLSFENTNGWTIAYTDQNLAAGYGGPKRGLRVFDYVKALYQ
ncbi:hypothetical protein B1748_34485 [Paenibacillus sp. MY03]|uniref:hypothetical protein n=1 Tax=Paenibacillus sp. MY03 TaxID=302980 RepID=UPI000B3CD0B5|nr:hypothetical protein [Paenibacillus sp. MY03]OUS68207.1 hypothetical protein B1748_34485 [Paenibacillus sp. MY03]